MDHHFRLEGATLPPSRIILGGAVGPQWAYPGIAQSILLVMLMVDQNFRWATEEIVQSLQCDNMIPEEASEDVERREDIHVEVLDEEEEIIWVAEWRMLTSRSVEAMKPTHILTQDLDHIEDQHLMIGDRQAIDLIRDQLDMDAVLQRQRTAPVKLRIGTCRLGLAFIQTNSDNIQMR